MQSVVLPGFIRGGRVAPHEGFLRELPVHGKWITTPFRPRDESRFTALAELQLQLGMVSRDASQLASGNDR